MAGDEDQDKSYVSPHAGPSEIRAAELYAVLAYRAKLNRGSTPLGLANAAALLQIAEWPVEIESPDQRSFSGEVIPATERATDEQLAKGAELIEREWMSAVHAMALERVRSEKRFDILVYIQGAMAMPSSQIMR